MNDRKTTIATHTKKPKLKADVEQTVDVLVRITPPDIDIKSKTRPKLNLSMVLDRSGSMDGSKMREAREAVKYCVDQMIAEDRFSTVIFDQHVDVLFESQKMNPANKALLKSEIDTVSSRGSTALHEAWVSGGLQVARHLDRDAINRVILVTDGQANVGETDPYRIKEQARNLVETGVSTSTIGIGRDFNEDLLMPMAEAGGGNAWHVQESEDMTRIFTVELNGLIGQTGSDVSLHVKTRNGVRLVDLLNDFEVDHSGDYKLPNLQAGSPLDVVVRLQVGPGGPGDVLDAAEFSVRYVDQDSGIRETAEARLLCEFADQAELADLSENMDVIKAVQLLMNARARLEAMIRMDRHDRAGAQQILRSVMAPTHALVSEAVSPSVRAELERELKELDMQADRIERADDDILSRKQMAYARYSRRTGK
jgi:Ca-activated chloride channel family protein